MKKNLAPVLARAALLGCVLAPAGDALAHGYVEGSRNKLCAEGRNGDCGAVRYEPQSVEGPDRYPGTGPADGTLAAAGSAAWAPLNVQSATRWTKTPIAPGSRTFHWHFTANHVSGDFRYFITRPDWNPDAPLARAQFEAEPFCVYPGNYVKPAIDTFHDCTVPERRGYQVILAIWDVGDTAASFYNAIDVDFTSGGSGFDDTGVDDDEDVVPDEPVPDGFVDVGDISPSMALSGGDTVRLRLFSIEGELAGRAFELVIEDDAAGRVSEWPRAFSRFVNDNARDVRAGALAIGGAIEPRRGANDVYARPASGIVRTELELLIDDVTSVDDPDEPSDARRYPDGLGGYVAGERIDGRAGDTYVCLVAGWCNGAASYYEPGEGLAWSSAWERVATGGTPPPPAVPEHVYPAGRGGYDAGSVVTGGDGMDYRCRVPGWCNSASALYYAPGSGLAWSEAWTRL